MFDGDTRAVIDIDDLAMAASDLLDQFRKSFARVARATQRTIVNRTLESNNLESSNSLKGLVAKFEAAIQAHDAEVAAAHVALEVQILEAMDQIF
jgi:hypothetical protein